MTLETNFRILVIDDNPAIHQDFIKILTTNNKTQKLDTLEAGLFGDPKAKSTFVLPQFQIDTATQGQEGVVNIKKAVAEGNPYALAFVDIRMPPGWDGIETIKHIWEVDKDMQIVICTAYSDYSWEETVQHLGTNDNLLILKKPFDNVAVRQLACALTKKWQVMHESRNEMSALNKNVLERMDTLQQSLSVIRSTFESSTDGILVVGSEGKIIDYNQQFVEMWKIPTEILETKDKKIFLNYALTQLQRPDEYLKRVEELEKNPDQITMDILQFKDGRVFERYSRPHKLKGKTVGRVLNFRDTTQRASLEQRLQYQATHDTLTDLPNRALLQDRMQQAISRAERNQTSVGVIFFDLDRFKLVNDSLTHQAGDELLLAVANRLSSTLRKEDTIARLGGDEFVIIVSLTNAEGDVISFASRLLGLLQKPFKIMHREILITASIGISIYPQDSKDCNELLQKADLAMYRAKELGSNQFQLYTNMLTVPASTRLEQEAELMHAIENEEFFLYYQPQIDIISDKVISVEALIRWQHPQRGVILPLDFIPLAEDSKLIIPIGKWVLTTACKQIKAWHDMGLPKISISVNVTALQFHQVDFVGQVKKILQETPLSSEFLEIEVTENIIVTNSDLIGVINKLKELGVRIVIDDFGTGSSNFNYIRKIPVDRLKIDKSFINNINNGKNDEVIIQAIIDMAHSLNLDVVAQGVETAQQVDFLKNKQCQEIQGYYFSKPLSAKDLEAFLRSK